MFEPVRGGTRGGQAEFKWSDVSADKDREHYLGHSINAPTGRWQKNKDVHWYSRDNNDGTSEQDEIRRIKELEAEALSVALGYGPTKKTLTAAGPTAISPGAPTSPSQTKAAVDPDMKAIEKAEKRRRKEAKREEKYAKKERRRIERQGRDRTMSRSKSPQQRRYRELDRARSRSPRRRSRSRNRPRSPGEGDTHGGRRHRPDERRVDQRDRDRRIDRHLEDGRRRWEDHSPRGERV